MAATWNLLTYTMNEIRVFFMLYETSIRPDDIPVPDPPVSPAIATDFSVVCLIKEIV